VFVSLPVVAWILHAAAIWIWHAPPLFQATLHSETVHTAQHLSFLFTGLLFWWALLRGTENRRGRVAGVLYLFTTALHTNLLGALLTFSRRVWYPIYGASTAPWGLTPLEDQQLAGLIMWIPAGIAYLVAALALIARVLREPSEPRSRWSPRMVVRVIPVLALMLSLGACRQSSALSPRDAALATGGDPKRGALAIQNWEGAKSNVGPPLAVPELGVPDLIARDMAAYLYTRE